METRRLNALEKYERLESKSDGYCQKSFYRQQRSDRKVNQYHKDQCKTNAQWPTDVKDPFSARNGNRQD